MQARAVRTREAVITAGREIFAELGWHGTTAKVIAARAGVSVGSFYAYFKDKGTLLRHLARERFDSVRAGFDRHESQWRQAAMSDEALRPIFQTVVREVMALHRADPRLHAVYTERRHVDPELDALTTAMERDVIERLAGLLQVATRVDDPVATAFVCFSMVEGAIHAHVIGEPIVEDERLVTATVDALVAITHKHGGSHERT